MNATTTTATTKKSTIGRLAAHLVLAAATGLGAITLGAGPAGAQLDPIGGHDVLQQRDGRWVRTGQIFVPDRIDPNNYVEHWVLFPGYVYPSATNGVEMKVAASKNQLRSEAEFSPSASPKGPAT